MFSTYVKIHKIIDTTHNVEQLELLSNWIYKTILDKESKYNYYSKIQRRILETRFKNIKNSLPIKGDNI